MTQLFRTAAVAGVCTALAMGQAPTQLKKVPFTSTVMGSTVKGAPYSADELTETAQVLGDGTHINRQSSVTVYRDGEGRVRRETPDQITIWDPVANVSYTLDPKSKTAQKIEYGPDGIHIQYDEPGTFVFQNDNFVMGVPQQAEMVATKKMLATTMTQSTADNTTFTSTVDPKTSAAIDKNMAELLAKLNAEMAASGNKVVINGTAANTQTTDSAREKLTVAIEKLAKARAEAAQKSESLGKQSFWGISADGTRSTSTIETGTIGNDRPIAVVNERWYSEQLQTVVMSKRSDPRTGDEIFRLTNVRVGEPGADMFMVPPGYTLLDGPKAMPGGTITVK